MSYARHFVRNSPPHYHQGGPGGGCDEKDRCFFNPHKYKVRCRPKHLRSRFISDIYNRMFARSSLLIDFVGRLLGSARCREIYSVRGINAALARRRLR